MSTDGSIVIAVKDLIESLSQFSEAVKLTQRAHEH